MTSFVMNPYLGDVNPGTTEGLKLYNKSIEARSEKIEINQENARDIQTIFEKDSSDFGWGPAISSVQIDNLTPPTTKSLLSKAREINLTMMQKLARRTWGNLTGLTWTDPLPAALTVFDIDPAAQATQRPQFFRRIRSVMIAKRIENSLSKASLKSLMLEKLKFIWTDSTGTEHLDGPTMLWILLAKINPSVRVGISSLKTNLTNATMPMYKHDVVELLDYMHEPYTSIYANYGTHTDYTLNLFNALGTAHNDEFLSFLSTLKDNWETSTVMSTDVETSDELRAKVLQKFNNMKQAKRWKRSKDPSSEVISALVTEVQDLKAMLTKGAKGQANATNNLSTAKKSKLFVPEWRVENKGESCTVDGTTWHWCSHHKREGLFDGMYMPHKECDHDAWAKKKKERWGKNKSTASNVSAGNSSTKLQLTDSMKQALITEGNMTSEQATALWSKIQEN